MSNWWAFSRPAKPELSDTVASAENRGESPGPQRTSRHNASKGPSNTAASSVAGVPQDGPPRNVNLSAQTVFHTSLESLILESTKHSRYAILRDSVQSTRDRHHYSPESLCDTLILACTLFSEGGGKKHRSTSLKGPRRSTITVSATATTTTNTTSATTSGGGAVHWGNEANLLAQSRNGLSMGDRASIAADVEGYPQRVTASQGTAHPLLLQSLTDLGKIFSLGLLSVQVAVAQRIVAVVRRLAFVPMSPRSVESIHGESLASSFRAIAFSQNPSKEAEDRGSGEATGAGVPITLVMVNDENLMLRLVQLVATLAAACPPGCPVIAELYGLLFLFYVESQPGSMLETTCIATLTHHTHTMLTALKSDGGMAGGEAVDVSARGSGGSSNTNITSPTVTSFTAQLQDVAFAKDMCRLIMGTPARWLNLAKTSPPPVAPLAPNMATPGRPHSSSTRHLSEGRKASWSVSSISLAGGRSPEVAGLGASVTDVGGTPNVQPRSPTPANEMLSMSCLPVLEGSQWIGSSESLTPAVAGGGAGAAATSSIVSERLRIFLLGLLISFFKDRSTTSGSRSLGGNTGSGPAAPAPSPLFVQCLNDCFLSIALWGLRAMGISDLQNVPPLLMEIMDTVAVSVSMELFSATQQFALALVTRHLPVMLNSTHALLHAQQQLIQCVFEGQSSPTLFTPSVWGEVASSSPSVVVQLKAVTSMLAKWRKALTSTAFVKSLLQLRAVAPTSSGAAGGPSKSTAAGAICAARDSKEEGEVDDEDEDEDGKEFFDFDQAPVPQRRQTQIMRRQTLPMVTIASCQDDGSGLQRVATSPFIQLITSTIALLSTCVQRPSCPSPTLGDASLSPSVMKTTLMRHSMIYASPVDLHSCITESLNLLTTFATFFSKTVEEAVTEQRREVLSSSGRTAASLSPSPAKQLVTAKACFDALHESLLDCVEQCLSRIHYDENCLFILLRGSSSWVQLSCLLELPVQRDAYLKAILTALLASDDVVSQLTSASPNNTSQASCDGNVTASNQSEATARDLPPEVLHSIFEAHERILEKDSTFTGVYTDTVASDTTADKRTARGASVSTTTLFMAKLGKSLMGLRPSTTSIEAVALPQRGDSKEDPATATVTPVLQQKWCSEDVQSVILSAVSRLQQKLLMLKSVHVIANNMGILLDSGWAIVGQCLALTEPILFELQLAMRWVVESSVEQELQEQWLSDVYHLRDALRWLCVTNTSLLPSTQLELFFQTMMDSTATRSAGTVPPRAASRHGDGRWRDTHYLTTQPPIARFHEVRGGVDQWLLMTESLCLSLISLLPYTESPLMVSAMAAPGQQIAAIARALRLWDFITTSIAFVSDQRVLECWVAAMGSRDTGATPHLRSPPRSLSPHQQQMPQQHQRSTLEAIGPQASFHVDEATLRDIEGTLTAVEEHIAIVAVQLCRSAARRRRGGGVSDTAEDATPPSATGAPGASAASAGGPPGLRLVMTAGPFAHATLVTIGNQLFATPTSTRQNASLGNLQVPSAEESSSVAQPVNTSFQLPFVTNDAAYATAALSFLATRLSSCDPLNPCPSLRSASISDAASTARDAMEQLVAYPFCMLNDLYTLWRQPPLTNLMNPSQPTRLIPASLQTRSLILDLNDDLNPSDASSSSGVVEQTSDSPTATVSNMVVGPITSLLTTASSAILFDVVKVVQTYGEDVEGVAWEPILKLLQQTALVESCGSGAGAPWEVTPSIFMDPLSAPIAGTGNQAASASPPSLQQQQQRVSSAAAVAPTLRHSTMGQAVECLNTAFRALESIQHNHIPSLRTEGLHQLIVCAGAFTTHRIDSVGERKLHINLSAVQLLWSIADYLVTRDASSMASTATAGGSQQPTVNQEIDVDGTLERDSEAEGKHDKLWCSLLAQLKSGCLDDRQEIRQSAMQTFFALVQTYGSRFSALCWRYVLQHVLLDLMAVVLEAAPLCAVLPPPLPAAASIDVAASENSRLSTPQPSHFNLHTDQPRSPCHSTDGREKDRLTAAFVAHPVQLEEMRVTLIDAASRVFVTHYDRMENALLHYRNPSPSGGNPQLPSVGAVVSGNYCEATDALEMFLKFCGDVCVVLRGTSGEQSALVAVHALHGIMVEMPGDGLHPHGIHLAWCSLERIVFRTDAADVEKWSTGSAPSCYQHTEAKQCSLSVIAAVVAALCDSFRLLRANKGRGGSWGSLPTGDRAEAEPGGGRVGSPLLYHSEIHRSATTTSPSPSQYFTRLLLLLKTVSRGSAIVNSYYFPSKAQTTLVEGIAAVWPTFSMRESVMLWDEVLMYAFPTPDALTNYILQDPQSRDVALISLRSALPPGSHPSYLAHLLDLMRGILLYTTDPSTSAQNSAAAAAATVATVEAHGDSLLHIIPPIVAQADSYPLSHEERVTLRRHMAVTAMDAVGALLLLQLASPKVQAIPCAVPSNPYTVPSLFIEEAFNFLQYTLWGPALAASPHNAVVQSLTLMTLEKNSDQISNDGGDVAPTSPVGKGVGDEGSRLASRRVSPARPAGTKAAPAPAQCRRDGVSTLCNVVGRLVRCMATLIRREEAMEKGAAGRSVRNASPLSITLPPHLASGIQTLERLVDDLADVVQVVVEQYEDVSCAAQVINILTLISSMEGTALANLGRRCYSLLQQWSGTAALQPDGEASNVASQPNSQRISQVSFRRSNRSHGATAPAGVSVVDIDRSHSQLVDVVRVSMESRNKLIMRQFGENPDDASAAALLHDTLTEILRVATSTPTAGSSDTENGSPADAAVVAQHLKSMAPELLQLVACCSAETTRSVEDIARERDLRQLLSYTLQALFSNYQSLPPSGVTGTSSARQSSGVSGIASTVASLLASKEHRRESTTDENIV